MRSLGLIVGCLLTSLATAYQAPQSPTAKETGSSPRGKYVITPGGSGPKLLTGKDLYPDKKGYIVFRPQLPGQTNLIGSNQAPPANPSQAPVPAPVAPPGTELPMPVATEKPARAKAGDPKVIFEAWDAAYIEGNQVGYYYTGVREFVREGKTYRLGVKELKMTLERFNQRVSLWTEDATTETGDGQIMTIRCRTGIGKDQMLSHSGTVQGDTITVQTEGQSSGVRKMRWTPEILGISKEATLLQDKKPKVGDSFEFLYYEARLNQPVKYQVQVKSLEATVVQVGQKPRVLLKLEQKMEPVQGFSLPLVTLWADPKTFEMVKMESDMPELGGRLSVIRTSRDIALRPPGKVPDLAEVQSISLNRAIPNVHNAHRVKFRVMLTMGELELEKVFASDARQVISNLDAKAKQFDLSVMADKASSQQERQAEPDAKYLGTSFFIDWDDDRVKTLAKQAIANLPATANPLQKALAVENWVCNGMRAAEFSQAMASCANTARTLSGDCSEYSMLATGMCRSLGIPARTAMGVVYAPGPGGKPILAYHMWFEVFAEGRWRPLDATLGMGGVGPGHLKITDASWHEENSFTPILPVLNVLRSRPKVEVLDVVAR